MTIYAATVVDTPGDPFTGDPAATLAEDGALLVRDGVIRARGSLAEVTAAHPGEAVTRLDGGLLLPGFVDTHVHFPQIRAIGGLGLPLLDWLERYALPEECKLADRTYAWAVAGEFTDGLVASGTTSRSRASFFGFCTSAYGVSAIVLPAYFVSIGFGSKLSI